MAQMFALMSHRNGNLDESAIELAVAADKINANGEVTAIVAGSGTELEPVCRAAAGLFHHVWKFDHADLSYPNAEVVRMLLSQVLPKDAVFLALHDTFAMDLCPGLSIKLDSAYTPDVVGIDGPESQTLRLIRQEYTGLVHAHVACDLSKGVILTLRPGSFEPGENISSQKEGRIVDKSGQIGCMSVRRRVEQVLEARVGDVDITKAEVLLSIGRGIEARENIELAEQLADALGAMLSCSRPVVDAKWLDKSRQVGSSGKTVKPKVYLAMGISGSFQHLAGIKGSPFMVAVNKNSKAPIFHKADVGIVEDILEFIPQMAEKLKKFQ